MRIEHAEFGGPCVGVDGGEGKKLDDTYKLAWQRGLKTTYYLRTLAATHAEKSTGKGGELNAVSASGGAGAMIASTNTGVGKAASAAGPIVMPSASDIAGPVCMMKPGDAGFEDCEACQ